MYAQIYARESCQQGKQDAGGQYGAAVGRVPEAYGQHDGDGGGKRTVSAGEGKISLFDKVRPELRARTRKPCFQQQHIQRGQQGGQGAEHRFAPTPQAAEARAGECNQRYGDGGFAQIMQYERDRVKRIGCNGTNLSHQRFFIREHAV